ncbi:hypothetical protein [Bartonella sp. B30(2025)]
MLKLFKNSIYSCIFASCILFFAHTINSNANVIKAQLQEEIAKTVSGKNAVMRAEDIAVIFDTEKQEKLALGQVEKVAFFNEYAGVWGGVGIISLLTTLLTGDFPNILLSLIALLL